MLISFGGVGSEGEQKIEKEYMDRYWSCVPLPPGSIPVSGATAVGLGGAMGGMLFCDEGRGVLRGPPIPGRVDWVVSAFWVRSLNSRYILCSYPLLLGTPHCTPLSRS